MHNDLEIELILIKVRSTTSKMFLGREKGTWTIKQKCNPPFIRTTHLIHFAVFSNMLCFHSVERLLSGEYAHRVAVTE